MVRKSDGWDHPITYPVLGESRFSKTVVMFSSYGSGMVIVKDHRTKEGKHSNDWKMSAFTLVERNESEIALLLLKFKNS